MTGSRRATCLGANSGSSSLRYLVCCSPSSINGISGRPAPNAIDTIAAASGSIEWTSRRLVTATMSSKRVSSTVLPRLVSGAPSWIAAIRS